MKKTTAIACLLTACLAAAADTHTVKSPDGQIAVNISDKRGALTYSATYAGKTMIAESRLGLVADFGDLSAQMSISEAEQGHIARTYTMTRIKHSKISHRANTLTLHCNNGNQQKLTIEWRVGNNDIAFRYYIDEQPGGVRKARIMSEITSFNFPAHTTTFLTPQSLPNTEWEETKPSYENRYLTDRPMTDRSGSGVGYTFPCLFRVGGDGWVLVSETGTTADYCGCRLSDYNPAAGYTVAFPQEGENNGDGTTQPAISLPQATPWRTITMGTTLKPIVETTAAFDNVEQLYEPAVDYKPGRYTWSWLIWQDQSCNYTDQKAFVDLAAEMGYEYTLIDANWDVMIGRENIGKLSAYARNRGVGLMLWYNSNGSANNAPQTPKNIMNNAIRRKKEMAWLQEIGVKGIKVDFFGGDKQQTMKLYEDILSDANDHGIMVIFHGCTVPRGWERMYPNFISAEAALASENVYFQESHAKSESFEMTMHPFCRNTVGSFDWGGVMLNRYMSRDNKSRHPRYTSDIFEIATAITNQSSVNCVAIMPNNLDDIPAFELDFLRRLPVAWDETVFIDGYPGRYAVIARRTGNKWYVGGINADDKPLTLQLNLPMLAGQTAECLIDKPHKNDELIPEATQRRVKIQDNGCLDIILQGRGGVVLF